MFRKTDFVTVYMQGGLGNQLFQYHFALNLIEKFNSDVILDVSMYSTFIEKRKPLLLKLVHLNRCSTISNVPYFFLNKLISKLNSNSYIETDISYNVNNSKKRIYYGYWQDQVLNIQIIDQIRKEFENNIEYASINNSHIFFNDNDLAIHVRRGDYLSEKNKVIYRNLSLNYYINAINLLKNNNEIGRVFIFSDDILWCKNNMNLDFDVIFVDWTKTEIEDFSYLMQFKRKVISNSTFSFWAALLSNGQTEVVAPEQWMQTSHWRPQYPIEWMLGQVE